VKLTDNFKNSLHTVLRELIDKKSARDNIDFTAYQLAKEIGMPRSLITSLTHPDEVKRVTNPRISTLVKIVEYFKSDGFNITLEDLLGIQTEAIDIQNESIIATDITTSIPIYSFEYDKSKTIGTIDLELSSESKNVFGLLASAEISPLFKAGSLFIIDQDITPKSNNLIAIRLNPSDNISIKKYQQINNKIHLKSLDEDTKDIILLPTTSYEILGVVIQINAKT
jgi:hypothetical protein